MTATVGHKYQSDLQRNPAAQLEELGEARGEGRAVVTVRETRGVEVSDTVREQLLAFSDLAASSGEDVVHY